MKEVVVSVCDADSDDDELVLAIDSIQDKIKRISRPQPSAAKHDHGKVQVLDDHVSRASHVQQSRITVRKSVLRIADRGTRKRKRSKVRGKISMARQSMFRSCEPAIAINGRGGLAAAEQEAVRRATVIAKALDKPLGMVGL